MSYYFSTTIEDSFDNAIQKVTDELKAEGFGILTDINLNETLKKKWDPLESTCRHASLSIL